MLLKMREFWRGIRGLNRVVCVGLLLVLALGLVAQERPAASVKSKTDSQPSLRWSYGAFYVGGFVPDYSLQSHAPYDLSVEVSAPMRLDIYSAGLQGGRIASTLHGTSVLRGRGEVRAEVIPFWMGRYPQQLVKTYVGGKLYAQNNWDGETFHGASVTPVILRWNFEKHTAARIVPWTQVGCGVLWTDHKFPISMYGPTSVFNFTPQVGAGLSWFHDARHSVDAGVKVVHISNASLGDHNPGLNQTIQFSAGFSWWK